MRRPRGSDEAYVKRAFWPKLKRVAGKVPFLREALALYYCALDPETPLKAKAIAFAALAYFILPLDGIPDLIAGLGFTDDASVLAAAVATVGRYIGPEHRARAAAKLDELRTA